MIKILNLVRYSNSTGEAACQATSPSIKSEEQSNPYPMRSKVVNIGSFEVDASLRGWIARNEGR